MEAAQSDAERAHLAEDFLLDLQRQADENSALLKGLGRHDRE
jgi:hypothetical protein